MFNKFTPFKLKKFFAVIAEPHVVVKKREGFNVSFAQCLIIAMACKMTVHYHSKEFYITDKIANSSITTMISSTIF